MKQKILSPKMRFKTFKNNSNWKEVKFSDLIQELTGGASIEPKDYQEGGIRTIPKGAVNPSGIADLSGSKYVNLEYLEKNITSKVLTGDLVTSLRDLVPTAPNMGRIVEVMGNEKVYIMPQGVYKLGLKNEVDKNFMIAFSNSSKYREIITIEKSGSTQVHLRQGTFLNISINVPCYEEQQKIGQFFKHLDKMIALQQRKIDKTKALKSAYLAEMFPAEGESVPKRRFAGYTDEWEKKKLGNIGQTFTGLSGKTKEDFGRGNAEFITYLNVFNNPISNVNITENVEVDKKQDEVKYGDVLFTTSSETPHEVGMSSVWLDNRPNVYLNSFCFGYRIKISISYLFIAHLFRSNMLRKQMQVLAQGISRYNISKNKVMDLAILLPSKSEQKKIGEFFKHIDDIITTQEQKLEKLKATKQAYLHEMFV